MVRLCSPYDEGITCLCDDSRDLNILRCFLSRETDTNSPDEMIAADSLHSDPHPGSHCQEEEDGLDTKVEIILAAAILSLIVLLFTWLMTSWRDKEEREGECLNCDSAEVREDKSRTRETVGPGPGYTTENILDPESLITTNGLYVEHFISQKKLDSDIS